MAQATKRTERQWNDHVYTWSEFVQKLGTPIRTGETVAEYQRWKSSSDPQERMKADSAKDVGGFVAGTLKDGLRKKDHVVSRSMICLDLDNADDFVWSDWKKNFCYAAALYSTHSHTHEKPRLRLIIPLAKELPAVMYEPIALHIIEKMGEGRFDPTTVEVNRFMYWPSCPIDGEFVFEHSDNGPLLDGESILKWSYPNWHDQTSWPVLSGNTAKVQTAITQRKQKAEEKKGWIGAFCCAYTIHEAIEAFVPDYERSDISPDRYTYVKGSTVNGVATYEDEFSYSHHATDPASEQLCNAFDLVRIHKFGHLDAGKPVGTQVTSLPSYKAMIEFCKSDEKCRIAVANRSRGFDLKGDKLPKWMAELELDKHEKILMNHRNVELILNNDPNFLEIFGFDEFTQRLSLIGEAPWPRRNQLPLFTDADENQLITMFDKLYGLRNREIIVRTMETVADQHPFHPIRDYLNSLEWDGTPRIDTLLQDHFNAAPSAYASGALRISLIGAVKRAFEPGCKHDTMLVLFGAQGQGKSTFVRNLAKRDEWFTDHLVGGFGSKDSREALLGAWLVEIAELAGIKKADAEIIKGFISTQVDHLRVPYGHRTDNYPRGCVFFGTTNTNGFINDPTGGRRFLVVDVTQVDGEKPRKSIWTDMPNEVDQIWAEAKTLYDQGVSNLLDPALSEEAENWQKKFQISDPRQDAIEDYLDTLLPDDWEQKDFYERKAWLESARQNGTQGTRQREVVCIRELYTEALGKGYSELPENWESNAIRNIVTNLKPENGDRWEYMGEAKHTFPLYGRQRYFRRVKAA